MNWKTQTRSTLGAAAAAGFLVDRTRLELLGSAYAVDVGLLAQLVHCLCLLLFLYLTEKENAESVVQFLLDFLCIAQEVKMKSILMPKEGILYLFI